MDRIPEPELMEDDEQARAYARADFDQPHSMYIEHFQSVFAGREVTGHVLDLGCGPADISIRFCRAFPACRLDGVDGALNMLKYGREAVERAGLAQRIHLIHGRLPDTELPRAAYDAVISNSLLHHLRDPLTLWRAVKRRAAPGAPVFVMDLRRPGDAAQARQLMETYAAGEPEVLRRDFFNSLLAAYTAEEVLRQLQDAGLDHLTVEVISDRHLIVAGHAA